MRIALVHDDLVQWGGAERVLVALSEIFIHAPIYTSVIDQNNPLINQYFKNKKIVTSFLQQMPGWKDLYRQLLPLYPIAFEQFDFSSFDLVISQTTRFAKSIITKPKTIHICYCHTPVRFLWIIPDSVNIIFKSYFKFLRIYDEISSKRVDYWIAGSRNAQQRISQYYKSESEVIYPFVDLDRFKGIKSFDGGYYLVIARLIEYKNVGLVIKVANRLKLNLKVVGDGPQRRYLEGISGPTIDFFANLNEEYLNKLIAGCRGIIVAAEEDFGLAALEAQALGKGVIAYGRGGSLETVIPGKTGYFFYSQTEEELTRSLVEFEKNGYNKNNCLANARRFSKQEFIKKFSVAVKRLLV